MIQSIRTCSELSTYKKIGISGVCTAIGYGLGATNPVTLAASAALPWLPNAMSRCLRRNPPELAAPRAAPQEPAPAAPPLPATGSIADRNGVGRVDQDEKKQSAEENRQFQQAILASLQDPNERQMQRVLEESKRDMHRNRQDLELERAIAASLQDPNERQMQWALRESNLMAKSKSNKSASSAPTVQNPPQVAEVFLCPYAQVISQNFTEVKKGGEIPKDVKEAGVIIPQALVFLNDQKKPCNVAQFILHVLMNMEKSPDKEKQKRDMLGFPISEAFIKQAANQLGIDYQTFLGIWDDVRLLPLPPRINPEDADSQISWRKDQKIQYFKTLLISSQSPAARDAHNYLIKYHEGYKAA